MTPRNFSPQQMFQQLANDHTPRYHFAAWSGEPQAWQEAALPEVLATLGECPADVPTNPELLAEWVDDGIHIQRWMIDVSPHISATLQVNLPPDLKSGDKRPAILCCHGHGPHGKAAVMGNPNATGMSSAISDTNYNYGWQMAKAGYVTFAIDWMGFGDRNDAGKPHFLRQGDGRDWCNLYYLHATMLGMTPLSINVTHGKRAIDFACCLAMVDPERIGVMGLSGGGTMALWMTHCDERIRATEIICYSDLWACFGIRDINYCGMQVAPGLFKLVDLPDLQGLLAPRPLLVDIGAADSCFRIDSAMACYRQVESIYRAFGAADRLQLDLHPNSHAWGANRSREFFGDHL